MVSAVASVEPDDLVAARDGDALLLAAGELGGAAVFQVAELDGGEQAARGGFVRRGGHDILERGLVREEGVVLEEIAEAAAVWGEADAGVAV